MAQVEIEAYNALPCELKVFTINGIKADYSDFGYSYDDRDEIEYDDYDEIARWGCLNRRFIANRRNAKKCMEKYNITIDEFNDICDRLEEVLSVGCCGWCV